MLRSASSSSPVRQKLRSSREKIHQSSNKHLKTCPHNNNNNNSNSGDITCTRVTARVLRDEEIFGDNNNVWSVKKDKEERWSKTQGDKKFMNNESALKKKHMKTKITTATYGSESTIRKKRRRVDDACCSQSKNKYVKYQEEKDILSDGNNNRFKHKKKTEDNMNMRSGKGKSESRYEYWIRIGKEGGYRSPRLLTDTMNQFEQLPWRINRDFEESEYIDGVERLSEKCLRKIKRQIKQGLCIDFKYVPDDFVFGILSGTANSAVLMNIEKFCPSKVIPLDAVWAKLCKLEYKMDKLDHSIPRWRALYEIKQEKQKLNMDKAKELLKKRYAAIEAEKEKHKISTRLIAPTRPTEPSYTRKHPGGNAFQRLRWEMRKTRAR